MVDLETAKAMATSAAVLGMPQVRSPADPSHHPMSPHHGSPGRPAPCPGPLLSSLFRRALVADPSTSRPTFVYKRMAAVRAAVGGGAGGARCHAGPRRAA